MTKKDLMANRILSNEVVDIISNAYYMDNGPSWEKMTDGNEMDEDVIAQRRYISPEKVQRMPPEEVVDYLVTSGYKKYEVRDCDTIIHVLSAATGRSEEELRNAIFGEGDFDARKFYQPTDLQKRVIRFVFSTTFKLQEMDLKWSEYKTWPKKFQNAWTKLVEEIPDEAMEEFTNDTKEYIEYYLKNGIPSWLY